MIKALRIFFAIRATKVGCFKEEWGVAEKKGIEVVSMMH